MVPDHPPEIFSGVRQGMLGNDKLIAPVVALVVVRKRSKNAINYFGFQYTTGSIYKRDSQSAPIYLPYLVS